MIQNQLARVITTKLGFEPTKGQASVIAELAAFAWEMNERSSATDKVFILKGYAGTGKTSVVSALVKALAEVNLKTVLLAPTGRAAKVLSGYSDKTASTIHKKIYRQKAVKDGLGEFVLEKNLHNRTLFIVDEASMIANSSYENSVFGTGRLLDDLLEYVYGGAQCKLLLVGDTAQLPPVGLEISPALEITTYAQTGFEVLMHELTEVVRQQAQSGILLNATNLRTNITEQAINMPKFVLKPFTDIIKLSGADLIEEIERCYSEFGVENTMVVCRSNKRANKYNEGIRRTVLWREDELCAGDFLMVVKNNYFWIPETLEQTTDFIANGDIVEITRVGKYQELYGKRFCNVSLRFTDYQNLEIEAKLMVDTLHLETAALTGEQNNAFFYAVLADYENLRTKKERIKAVKENPYFNALQVKYSYAITCHKAQGGQWKAVFIDQGWFAPDMLNVEFLRWLYTAFTRPVERLYLVNFNDDFFS